MAKSAIKTQHAPGAPQRNQNAVRHGLYTDNPPVKIDVAADAALPELADMADVVGGAALWLAEELQQIEDWTVDVDDIAPLVALYAQVAGAALPSRRPP